MKRGILRIFFGCYTIHRYTSFLPSQVKSLSSPRKLSHGKPCRLAAGYRLQILRSAFLQEDKPKRSSFHKSACWWNKTNSQAITKSLRIKKGRLQGSINQMPFAYISQMKSVPTFQSLALLLKNKIQHNVFLRFPNNGASESEMKATIRHTSTCWKSHICSMHILQYVYLHIRLRVIHLIHLYMFQSYMLHIY